MVRREEKIHSNESGDNMHKWNEITDENSLKEFMERVSFFHDSCIKEMHYLSGAYVNENLDMYPVNDRRILRVIIQRQYEEDSMIEMEFQGLKYLKLFQGDMNFYALCSAVKENDFKTAFNAAHTLKGLALNLSLTSLADRTKELTELLRGGDPGEGLASLLERTTRTYASVLECINTLIDE